MVDKLSIIYVDDKMQMNTCRWQNVLTKGFMKWLIILLTTSVEHHSEEIIFSDVLFSSFYATWFNKTSVQSLCEDVYKKYMCLWHCSGAKSFILTSYLTGGFSCNCLSSLHAESIPVCFQHFLSLSRLPHCFSDSVKISHFHVSPSNKYKNVNICLAQNIQQKYYLFLPELITCLK